MDNFTPEMSEKLVQYLDGNLTISEKELLEQQLAGDTALQEELKSLQATREAVRLYGLKQKVSDIHQQMMKEMQPKVKQLYSSRKIIRYAMAIAASILLVFAGYTVYNLITITPENIFASNFQTYELVTNRGDSTDESTILKDYREKNYNAVIGVVYDRVFTAEELFIRGMSFAELKKIDSAIVSFKKVLEANKVAAKPVYNDETEYYLALLYVRIKDYSNALELLNKINETPDHLYHNKVAGKLIRDVKKLKKR